MKRRFFCLVSLVCIPFTSLIAQEKEAAPLKVGEFTFKAVDAWKSKDTPRPMSEGGYTKLSSDGKETLSADFYYFGSGQGGDVEANVTRWKGQFQPAADGTAVKFDRKDMTFGKRKVTLVFLKGTFMSGGMMTPKTPMPGSAMIGAILESAGGNVFIKFTGPEKEVDASKDSLIKLIGTAYPDAPTPDAAAK